MPTNDGYMPLGGGGGGGGGGTGAITGSIALKREAIATNQAIAAGDSFTEVTLTKAPSAGDILTFVLVDTPNAYAVALWDDIVAYTGASSNPGKSSSAALVVKIQTPGNDGFSHDSFFIVPSDESTKIWLGIGRDSAQTVTIYRHYMSHNLMTPAAEGGGAVELDGISFQDVTDEHHPEGPDIGDRDVSMDFSQGRIWMSGNVPVQATPAEGDATDVTVTGRFRGARLIHPTLPVEHDSYYSYRDGAHHWWSYVLDPTYGGVWSGVDFAFVVARVDAFATGAIWLGEHFDSDAAAAVISNFDTTKEYYFFSQTRSRVQEITNSSYVVGVSASTQVRLFSFIAGRHVPPPTGIWYIHGQTERWPSTFAYDVAPQNNRLRIRWTGGAPDENPYGSWEIPDHWVVGADIDNNIDGSSAPVSGTDFIVFSLPAGVYDIEAVLSIAAEDTTLQERGILLYQIQSGDDKVLAATPSHATNMPANFGNVNSMIYRCGIDDYALVGDEELYFMAFTTLSDDWRGYLTVRKKA